MSFVNPAPGATQGRTDQGVDWSNVRSIVAVAAGKIVNVFPALSGFGQTIIEKLTSGQDIYYGQETSGGSATVQAGETVTQGEQIATGKGGAIEVGYWNPATGHAAGYQPGVTSGGVTAAGQSFASQISGSGSPTNDLAQLWIDAGGSPQLANTMAAIAMAESGGNVSAQNSSSKAAGLWQILPSAHPQYDVNRLLSDPLYNAQAAVAIFKSQGLTAWQAYTNGSYRQFLSGAASAMYTGAGPTYSLARPGGEPASGSGGGGGNYAQILQEYTALRDTPRSAPPGTTNPFKWWMSSFTGNWNTLSSNAPQ